MTLWYPAPAPPPAAGPPDPDRWLLGLAATHRTWPPAAYTFHLPGVALPLYANHQEHQFRRHGPAPGDVGTCRLFEEIGDLGLVTLIEIHAGYAPSIMRDIGEGRLSGLSIQAVLDKPPGGGPTVLYLKEVSLTSRPADRDCRVVSTGRLALQDWEALTGTPPPAFSGAASR